MILRKFRINAAIFDQMMYDYEFVIENRDLSKNLSQLIDYMQKPTSNCHTVYYDELNQMAVVNYLMLEGYNLIDHVDYYMQRCIVIRTENADIDEIYQVPYAKTCKKYIYNILYSAGYTDAEIDERYKACSISNHVKPIHSKLPYYYDMNKIHEIHNCVYYDINNAHLDALCEIFPKAKRKFIRLRSRINKAKAEGDINTARRLKDYVNIFCGNLGHYVNDVCETRGTYEWIVNRTRNIVEKAISEVGGCVIYANTDGFIINDPTNKLVTSDKLGQFKSELKDDVIYAFTYADPTGMTSGYTLYQYVNSKGKVEQKGTLPCQLRKDTDLSTGQVVTYKKHMTDKQTVYYDNINKEIKEIEIWHGTRK